MYCTKHGEALADKLIAADLRQSAVDYENGEIMEVRDRLLNIVEALNKFIEEAKMV